MFIITGSLKVGISICTVAGGGAVFTSIYYKTLLKDLLEDKFDVVLATRNEPLDLNLSEYDFKNTDDINSKIIKKTAELSEQHVIKSKEQLFVNDNKNYKCLIPVLQGEWNHFDVKCEIFKISAHVKKTSDILKNLEPLTDTRDIDFYDFYVVKISKNLFSKYDFSKKMPIHVVPKDSDSAENKIFSLNVSYKYDEKTEKWLGIVSNFLVSFIWKKSKADLTKEILKNESSNIGIEIKREKLLYSFASSTKIEDVDDFKKIDFTTLTPNNAKNHINHKTIHVIRGLNYSFSSQIPVSIFHARLDKDWKKSELLKFQCENGLIGFFNPETKKQKFYVLDN